MFLESESFDDLLRDVFIALHKNGRVDTATRGNFIEIIGVLLKLHNPRARLSRSEAKGRPFSSIGELFWYLSGRNDLDFMRYFLPDYAENAEEDGTLHGAYGPRLFPIEMPSQFDQIVNAIQNQPTTRRAVIQLYSSHDIEIGKSYKEIPCTNTIQFLLRNNQLQCIVNMRSNDAFKRLPHDVFCFTMMQEMLAQKLEVECGTYHHCAGSLHLYESDIQKSETYLEEGYQSQTAMPPMPPGDPFILVETFLQKMKKLRDGEGLEAIGTDLPEYWNDLLLLLAAYHHSCEADIVDKIQQLLSEKTYFPYVERRKTVARPKSD